MDQIPSKFNWRPVLLSPAKVMRPIKIVDKVNQQLLIDAFTVDVADEAVSYIAAVISTIGLTTSYSLRVPFRKPSNFVGVPAVSWVDGAVRLRYKLWEGGEFAAPLYAGEVIPADAIIEIWTDPGTAYIELPVAWQLPLTLLDIPTSSAQEVGTIYATSLCSIFLTNYPPANLSQYFTTCAT